MSASGRSAGASRSRRLRVLVVIGTRPEAIKLAPVILAFAAWPHEVECHVGLTSQHASVGADVLDLFGIRADFDLGIMTPGQTPTLVASRALDGMERALADHDPDMVVIEGDTTTVMAAAIAAFHARIPVAHVEAGLRSYDMLHPFPEEANRRIATLLSRFHLAPTEHARRNLLAEGVDGDTVWVTGNPGLDALRLAVEGALGPTPPPIEVRPGERLILVTAHRRESLGGELETICDAVATIAAARRESVRVVFPVHPNPKVGATVRRILGQIENVTLLGPLPYPQVVALLQESHLILTDSGGLQEEGPALGKPVLVVRETTERPEAVDAGAAIVIGRRQAAIVEHTLALLDDPIAYAAMAVPRPIYGDGHAAERIVRTLLEQAR
jgi:UDP-N-acetylglucosamine 2-epimerase (non-hydrolysing)